MKTKILFILIVVLGLGITSCTDDFTEMNKNPNAITKEEASARYFFTGPEVSLHKPNRFAYWRAILIHSDRYAGHFTFGFNGSWWSGELGYAYSSGYTNAAWGHYDGYFGSIDNFLSLTEEGGEFENQYMHAVGMIMKALYYQKFTDIFGYIPYTEAGKEGVVTPKFDSQETIYKGVIDNLDAAINTIGDKEKTGEGIENLGENDVIYDGDLQRWKRLAYTLKLRMALRAHGASGDDFSESAIQDAVNSGMLLESDADNALIPQDTEISQWAYAVYGDIWHSFGTGSNWKVSRPLIDHLREYNDPRLGKYAKPATGGTVELNKGNLGKPERYEKYVNFFVNMLDSSDVNYQFTNHGDTIAEVTIPENTNYIGQPVRMSPDIYPFVKNELFSEPADIVINPKGSSEIFPEIVLSTADAYFMRAKAAAMGITNENAASHYEEGIRHAMSLWDVSASKIDEYIANSELGSIAGNTQEEQIRKISIQRWLASYTDGFEAWSIVRKSGYPECLANGVDDNEIYGFGDLTNGVYPQRLRYGTGVFDTNPENAQAAIDEQGPNLQSTKLWWAKD